MVVIGWMLKKWNIMLLNGRKKNIHSCGYMERREKPCKATTSSSFPITQQQPRSHSHAIRAHYYWKKRPRTFFLLLLLHFHFFIILPQRSHNITYTIVVTEIFLSHSLTLYTQQQSFILYSLDLFLLCLPSSSSSLWSWRDFGYFSVPKSREEIHIKK